VTDGGGNNAKGNGLTDPVDGDQCLNIAC
jgi:hypothetical protein